MPQVSIQMLIVRQKYHRLVYKCSMSVKIQLICIKGNHGFSVVLSDPREFYLCKKIINLNILMRG